MNSERMSATSKAGLAVVLGTGALAWVLTVLAFFHVGRNARGESFWFALAHMSFLEALVIAYCAAPCFLTVRRRMVAALYPVFGFVLGCYVLRALVMGVITHTVPLLDSPATHLISALGGLLPMLVLTGILFVLNVWQRERDDVIRAERADLAVRGADVAEIYHGFLDKRSLFGQCGGSEVEPLLRKLKERFQFCTPFHRTPPGAPGMNEEIQTRLAMLHRLVNGIGSLPEEQRAAAVCEMREAASGILHAMERREKLLVK